MINTTEVIIIRKNNDKDISEEEFNTVLKPFIDSYDAFIKCYIIPEVVAYYIANAYYRNAMYETTFIQEYNSAKDLINLFNEDYEKTKAEVIKLLKIKYALEVISEEPLNFKKVEY